MKNIEVRKALLEADLQITDVAKKIGYTRGHVSGVITGRYNSPKVKIGIALLLKRDVADLWDSEKESE